MTKDFKDICEWLVSVVNDVEKKLVEFPGSRNRGPTSLLALKIRTPVANTGKLRSNGQVPVARGGEILYFTASRRKINIDFLL
jgi:hypothetical protein